jgi:hypothetical protein
MARIADVRAGGAWPTGEELEAQPCAGGIFMTVPGVKGVPETPFGS